MLLAGWSGIVSLSRIKVRAYVWSDYGQYGLEHIKCSFFSHTSNNLISMLCMCDVCYAPRFNCARGFFSFIILFLWMDGYVSGMQWIQLDFCVNAILWYIGKKIGLCLCTCVCVLMHLNLRCRWLDWIYSRFSSRIN